MTCQRIIVPDMTLWEAKEQAGMEHGGFLLGKRARREADRLVRMTDAEIAAEEDRIERSTICPGGEWMTCGDFELEPLCECGVFADLLCDYPMGKGKTCDVSFCPEHGRQVGEDRHLCLIHFAEFQGKSKIDRINPWPPKRKASR